MSRSTSDVTASVPVHDDGTIAVEAATAGAALEEVTRRLGHDAEILQAGKVTRGGIAGFFARELVQLQARPRANGQSALSAGPAQVPALLADDATAPVAAPDAAPDPASGSALGELLASLAASTDDQERTFAEVLREQQSRVRTPVHDRGEQHGGDDARPQREELADPAPKACPGPAWSVRNLQNLGLPALVTEAVRDCDTAEDVQWVTAVANALATLCRPLPAGACVYVGPRCRPAAEAADVALLNVGDRVPAAASFGVQAKATEQVRAWLDAKRGRRWLHLVVGAEGWRDFLFDEPLAVSWSSRHDLCEAIRVSAELGLVLGSGPMPWHAGDHRRATPVDVAMAIRDLLPQR